MSIELVQVSEDIHLDYSDVYTNKNNRVTTTENTHKRILSVSIKKESILDIMAHRFNSNNISFSLTNQASLFDLYTFIKVQCYKDAYHIRKPMFTIRQIPIDFIPPKPKNPLACIIHQLAVLNKNEDILIIPNDPRMTIETFMETHPDFFTKTHGKYTIYILDEYVVQRHIHKTANKSSQGFMVNLLKKYISCAPQR